MQNNKVVIDLTNNLLTEAIYTDFSLNVKKLLMNMYFAGFDVTPSIRGSQSQIESFFKALSNEKKYMDAYMKYGLSDPITLQSRGDLMGSVGKFERETGLVWPFKN